MDFLPRWQGFCDFFDEMDGWMDGFTSFLAQLFSKKTSRYCHSPGVGGGVQKL